MRMTRYFDMPLAPMRGKNKNFNSTKLNFIEVELQTDTHTRVAVLLAAQNGLTQIAAFERCVKTSESLTSWRLHVTTTVSA